jgi:CheY-like chemotaxis protein
MLSHRGSSLLEERPASGRNVVARASDGPTQAESAIVRLLVLDRNPVTPQLIENALWVWPHRIATADSVQQAVKMCQHLEPAALIVSLDFPSQGRVSIIRSLREQMPAAVIIALGTRGQISNSGPILDMGANAVLTREALQRPTLHDLLMRLQPQPADENTRTIMSEQSISMPWRESQMIGSLICDIKGIVSSVNPCLVRWLEYPAPSALVGKCVWRDILDSRTDWQPWKSVAGDMTALLRHAMTVKASNGQRLWMDVEVFAAPDSPSDIQAIFVDQSELAHLSGRIGNS